MIFCRHREMIFVIRQWETSFTIDRQSGFLCVCVCSVFCTACQPSMCAYALPLQKFFWTNFLLCSSQVRQEGGRFFTLTNLTVDEGAQILEFTTTGWSAPTGSYARRTDVQNQGSCVLLP